MTGQLQAVSHAGRRASSCGGCRAGCLTHKLLDWFVVFGTKAFSVAEFAPRPAQW